MLENDYKEASNEASDFAVENYFESMEMAEQKGYDGHAHIILGLTIAAGCDIIAHKKGYNKHIGRALGILTAASAGAGKEYLDWKTRYTPRPHEAAEWVIGALMYTVVSYGYDGLDQVLDGEEEFLETDIDYDQIRDQVNAEGIYDSVRKKVKPDK